MSIRPIKTDRHMLVISYYCRQNCVWHERWIIIGHIFYILDHCATKKYWGGNPARGFHLFEVETPRGVSTFCQICMLESVGFPPFWGGNPARGFHLDELGRPYGTTMPWNEFSLSRLKSSWLVMKKDMLNWKRFKFFFAKLASPLDIASWPPILSNCAFCLNEG